MSAPHRLNQLELEVQATDPERGRALIERLSAMRQRRLEPLLDRVFSELSPLDRLDRLDRIELDLGEIDADNFEDDLIGKLEAALRDALARALPTRARPAPEAASLELIRAFALTGNLPWWADRAAPDGVSARLAELAREAPGALRALLPELAPDAIALARLAELTDDAVIAAILAEEPALLAELRELERALVSAEGPRWRARVRAAVLAALAREARGAPTLETIRGVLLS